MRMVVRRGFRGYNLDGEAGLGEGRYGLDL